MRIGSESPSSLNNMWWCYCGNDEFKRKNGTKAKICDVVVLIYHEAHGDHFGGVEALCSEKVLRVCADFVGEECDAFEFFVFSELSNVI